MKMNVLCSISCTTTTKDTIKRTSRRGLVHHGASIQWKTTRLLYKGMRPLSIMG